MLKLLRFSSAPLALLIPTLALAQPLPAEEDDLELPASPVPQPQGPAPQGPAPQGPAPQEPAPQPPAPGAAAPQAPAPQAPAPGAAAPGQPAAAPPPNTPAPAVAGAPPALREPSSASNQPTKDESRVDALRTSGYVQGEYQWNRLSEDQLQPGGAPLNQNRFLVRRARLRFERAWEYAAGRVEVDANTVSGTTFGLRLAEASLVYRGERAADEGPLATLTIGVTDIPFGYELAESARLRPFMERSLGSGSLFPTEADAGVKLSGAVSYFRYGVAFMNGEPLDASGFPRDPNSAKDLIGRVGVEVPIAGSVTVWGGSSFAKGRGFHPGRDARKRAIAWRDTDESGTLQPGSELQGLPAAAASPSKNFDRWVLGLDLGVAFETPLGLSKLYAEGFVASNYDRGLIQADPVESSIGNLRHAGGHAAVVQELGAYGLAGFRASLYDPNSDVLDSSRGELLPHSQTIRTFSALGGFVLENRAKLLFQYDFVRDHLARDEAGRPTDADNDQFTARLQVEL